MKIEMNTIYHLPTQAHEDDFLKQAEKQGLRWSYGPCATDVRTWRNEEHCIRVGCGYLAGYDSKAYYELKRDYLPIIEWKIGFTKADMQIGQTYKQSNQETYIWREEEFNYDNNLHYVCRNGERVPDYDIVEVYAFDPTPIWKREEFIEPKYRVKTELTKEQAEKLGLELCEVIE